MNLVPCGCLQEHYGPPESSSSTSFCVLEDFSSFVKQQYELISVTSQSMHTCTNSLNRKTARKRTERMKLNNYNLVRCPVDTRTASANSRINSRGWHCNIFCTPIFEMKVKGQPPKKRVVKNQTAAF